MKLFVLVITTLLFFTACQDNSPYKKKAHPTVMGGYYSGQNPNSLANISANKAKDRVNKIELSKIDAEAKIKIAKINSVNELSIAKVYADAKKEVAITDSTTKIKTKEIDAIVKKDSLHNNFYISIAIVIIFLVALFLLYFNNKKSRELKRKLHQDKLQHEQLLKERELEEKRLHKMLELVGEGKLSSEMEQEVILSLTQIKQKTKLLDSN